MRTVKIRTVVMSHLNDALIEVSMSPSSAMDRISFAKRLVALHDDLDEMVSDEYLNEQWGKMYKSRSF